MNETDIRKGNLSVNYESDFMIAFQTLLVNVDESKDVISLKKVVFGSEDGYKTYLDTLGALDIDMELVINNIVRLSALSDYTKDKPKETVFEAMSILRTTNVYKTNKEKVSTFLIVPDVSIETFTDLITKYKEGNEWLRNKFEIYRELNKFSS